MSTTTRATTEAEYVRRDKVADRWEAVRAFLLVLVGMLTWTVAWAGGPAAAFTIVVGILALVAVDVLTKKAQYAAQGL